MNYEHLRKGQPVLARNEEHEPWCLFFYGGYKNASHWVQLPDGPYPVRHVKKCFTTHSLFENVTIMTDICDKTEAK